MNPLLLLTGSIFRNKVQLMMLVLMFGFISQSLGQEGNTKKYQIGLNLFSLKQTNNTYDPIIQPAFFTGITFKRNYSNFTLRSSLNYSNYYSKFEEKGFDSYVGEIDYSKWLLAFGLQKSLNYKKISFYYGLDLFGGLGIRDCDISGGWIQRLDGVYYDLWFGISPVIGIQYDIVSRISVSIETSLDLALVYGNYDFHGVKLNFEPLLNPINAISINYSF